MIQYENVLQKIQKFTHEQIDQLHAFKKTGIVAAYFCPSVPLSLLDGMRIWPVRCITGTTHDKEKSAESLVKPEACSFCKTILGNFLLGSFPQRIADCVCGLITCDQMRRTLERLSSDIGIPVFPLQVPATTTQSAAEYFVSGVQDCMQALKSYYSLSIDYALMRSVHACRLRNAQILKKITYETLLPAKILHQVIHLSFWTQPEAFHTFLQELLDSTPVVTHDFTVILTGSVIGPEDDSIFTLLSDKNIGCIPFLCSGISMMEQPGIESYSSDNEEFVRALCIEAFHTSLCIRKRPNTLFYEKLKACIDESKSRGVILKTLHFCDLWYTEKQHMSQNLPVPCLVLDSGYYSQGGHERIQTRMDAFLEMIA